MVNTLNPKKLLKSVYKLFFMFNQRFERFPVFKDFCTFELDSNRFPKLAAWIERMKKLPAVQEVIIQPEEYSKFFKGYLSGEVVYDFD